jgi:hypothetical protein
LRWPACQAIKLAAQRREMPSDDLLGALAVASDEAGLRRCRLRATVLETIPPPACRW